MRRHAHFFVLVPLFAVGIACSGGSNPSSASNGDAGVSEASSVTVIDGGDVDGDATVTSSDWSLALGGAAVGGAVPTAANAIVDDSGNHLDATASSGLVYAEGHPVGVVGMAFDGSGAALKVDDATRVGALVDLGASDPFTLEVGFRTGVHGRDDVAGQGVLFDRTGSMRLAIMDGHLVFTLGATSVTLDTVNVSDGLWHRAIVTRDPSAHEIRISVDAANTVKTSDSAIAIRGSGGLVVGAAVDGSDGFFGTIDHVRFHRVATPAFDSLLPVAHSIAFSANVEPVPSGGTYTSIRIPAMITDATGRIYIFAEGRVDSSCDFGNNDIVEKYSDDLGTTWSSLVRVLDYGTQRAGNVIPFYDSVRDRLVAVSTTTDINPPTTGCTTAVDESSHVVVQFSTDRGSTWSAPKDITTQVNEPTWSLGGLMGPGHGIQLTQGTNAGVLALHMAHIRKADGVRGSAVIVSRDGGETWSIATVDESSQPNVDVNEGSIAELTDGRLYANTRNQNSTETITRGDGFVKTDLTYASTPAFVLAPEFRGPVVHGSTLRWIGSDRFGDAPSILFSFPAGKTGTNFTQRHDLRLYASVDDAKTFSPSIRVAGGLAAYSDVVPIGSSHVGVVYEGAKPGETTTTEMDFVTLTREQADEPTIFDWTFESLTSAVSTASSAGLHSVDLVANGSVTPSVGRHHSTAAHFSGSSRLCAAANSTANLADFDVGDGFELDVTFATTSHTTGDADGSGTLIAKTIVGTESAFWLRVQNGHVAFAVGDDVGNLDIATSTETVTDGAYHRVRARRDVANELLTVSIDDGTPATVPITTTGVVTNDTALCVGAFDGTTITRAFEGDIDDVALRVVN